MFRDEIVIHVKAGSGGSGCISFRREKYVPRGGPNGGDGGKGGEVILEVDESRNSLYHLSRPAHFRAGDGEHGQGKNCHGASGRDCVIPVAPGTVVKVFERGLLLKDLRAPGERLVVARGGRGGRGNRAFATPTNQAPREAEPGEEGEERRLQLELKLFADAGLVGLPNAGKSTLLSSISDARPKIAEYPFTTLVPQLGIVEYSDFRTFVAADLPGLIEGAHRGAGLGDRFLRHVERTRVILHCLDGAAVDRAAPLGRYEVIRRELEQHHPELACKPEVVVVTKLDLPGAPEAAEQLRCELPGEVLAVSAVTGQGVSGLKACVGRLLDSRSR